MRTTRTFKVSGLATALGVLCVVLAARAKGDVFGVLGGLLLMCAAPTFVVSAIRHLLRGALWRVGSRLFVSYLLIGVVPLPFLFGLAALGTVMVAGQIAARRLDDDVRRRAGTLVTVALEGLDAPLGARAARLDGWVSREGGDGGDLPGLSYAVFEGETVKSHAGALDPASLTLPKDTLLGPFVLRTREDIYLAALSRGQKTAVLAAAPLASPPFKRALAKKNGTLVYLALSFPETGPAKEKGDVTLKANEKGVVLERTGEKTPRKSEFGQASVLPPAKSDPLHNRFVSWGIRLDLPAYDGATGEKLKRSPVAFFVQTSLAYEFEKLFGEASLGSSRMGAGNIFLHILTAFGIFTVFVYVVASLVAGLLVFRIARATRRLSRGFAEVEAGNFAHRALLRGNDQLAGLVASFNRMTEHLRRSVAERAEQEALAHELELARDLQRRLLPPQDFSFPGLEIAADFRPASAIGGDFYHLLPGDDSTLDVVVADVSGHGLSTGIVMASAKASLSALASTTADAATLFTRLDREVREATDARTFVTLAHARFRLREKRVELTNAGHIYPYRIPVDGAVTWLENPSRPLGLTRPGTFRTVTSPLAEGDLWLLLSDGIVEACDAAGEPFGFERLEAVLAGCAGKSAVELKNAVLAAWRAHRGSDEPEDDRTLVAVRVEPTATSAETSR